MANASSETPNWSPPKVSAKNQKEIVGAEGRGEEKKPG